MKQPTITELKPLNQKSFYRKAWNLQYTNKAELKSYETIVCRIDFNDGSPAFIRLWDGYSVTTMNHINAFRVAHGMDRIGKKEWSSMPVYQ